MKWKEAFAEAVAVSQKSAGKTLKQPSDGEGGTDR
jgi:hypothetical protein